MLFAGGKGLLYQPPYCLTDAHVRSVTRGGRLGRDTVSVPLSGSSADWIHPVPLSRQKSTSIVIDSRHDSTRRLNQSTAAAR